MNERLADLVKQHAKNYADSIYRRTRNVTDTADLIRLTAEAAGVERFIQLMTAPVEDRSKIRK